MKFLAIAAIAGACSSTCLAHPPTVYSRLTGQQLVELMAMPAGVLNTLQLDARGQHRHQVAQAYIDGVVDASAESAWCPNGITKPDTIDEKVIWGLRGLPRERLQERAAPLIIDILRKQLPCTKQQAEVAR